MCVHALHTVHTWRDLCDADGRLRDRALSRPYLMIQIHSSVPIIMSFTFITPETSLPFVKSVICGKLVPNTRES